MNLESLTVALRPRSAWEAVELGTALVRRHAGAIWKPWLLLTLPLLVVLNALAWAIDAVWLAGIAMWWLKPAFDRIPLYVLSRAVFGDVPSTAQTLRAQWPWGRRGLLAHLSWRRLSPVRALYLPVDLLEGGDATTARQRRGTLGGPVYGVAALTTLVCFNFELALYFGGNLLALMFVPDEYLAETARAFWQTMLAEPTWLQLTTNALFWLAVSVIEPFYVGAGFGLYLNRRTEIEAWDIEIVLRRLRARLLAAAQPLLLCVVLGGSALLMFAPSAQAQTPPSQPRAEAADVAGAADGEDEDSRPATPTLPVVFGSDLADDRSLRKAVEQAYADPQVTPRRQVTRWKKRDPEAEKSTPPMRFEGLGRLFALISEFGLWALFGLLALGLLITSPRWLKWLRETAAAERREPDTIAHAPLVAAAPLPGDIPAAVRRLWQDGHQRDALALLYRASVAAMAVRANATLVPGATEAQCLRAARAMPQAGDRDAFARVVRMWQYAAYARQLPTDAAFEQMLDDLGPRFGWVA